MCSLQLWVIFKYSLEKIEEDVKTTTEILLVCHGQEVTPTVRQHLMKFRDAGLLGGQVLVMAQRDKSASAA